MGGYASLFGLAINLSGGKGDYASGAFVWKRVGSTGTIENHDLICLSQLSRSKNNKIQIDLRNQ